MFRYNLWPLTLWSQLLSIQGCYFRNLSATLAVGDSRRPSMSKPSTEIPGISAMTDTLDFVKNLWGGMGLPGMNLPSMGIPGMIMPTLSLEEINKQISDLKAVESWLTLNMNMLRSTIQALEVQSATISTLQSMSATLSAAVQANSDAVTKSAAHAKTVEPVAEPPKAPPAAQPAAEPAKSATPNPQANAAQLANPAIWWSMLQDQFKQAVDTAMASEKQKPTAKEDVKKTVEPPADKPAAKKTAAPRTRKAAKPKEA
jgi:hypothetical protein